jgi:hypothetical protein
MTEQHRDFDAFDRQAEDIRDKWLRHRAKPEVWARVESYGNKDEKDMLNCLLELRTRMEALEAAAKPAESNCQEMLDSSLVDLVTATIDNGTACDRESARIARDAILEIAAWLRLHTDLVHGPQCARWLEDELKKPL